MVSHSYAAGTFDDTPHHWNNNNHPSRVLQKNMLGGWGLGTTASVQLTFKRGDGQLVKTATLKSKGSEPEQLPLFSSKDTLAVEVGCQYRLGH